MKPKAKKSMGKQIISLFLALCLVLVMLPGAGAAAGSTFTAGGLKFQVLEANGTATDNVKVVANNYSGTTYTVADTVYNNGVDYTVTEIGDNAFYDCISLGSITIGNSVGKIGNSAFSGCTGLTSITIPDSVADIGASAFYGCTSLTSITIPGSVTDIGGSALVDCPNLTTITVAANNSNYASVENVLFNKNKTTLYRYPSGKTDGSYTVPDSVTRIDHSAFHGGANLASITLGSSVTRIEPQAFYGCTGLTGITIPDSVNDIGYYAFAGCTSLAGIRFLGDVPPTFSNTNTGNPFDGITDPITVTVPTGKRAAYEAALAGLLPSGSNIVENTTPVTGDMVIGGTTVPDLTQNASGTGWNWNASAATLTLDSGYQSGNRIEINCQASDTVNLVYSGAVSVTLSSVVTNALSCAGSLNISEDGSGGTLTLALDARSANYSALKADGKLAIASGTVNASASNGYAVRALGDTVISGGSLTADNNRGTAMYIGDYGSNANSTLTVSGGTVTLTSGYHVGRALDARGGISVSAGTLNATQSAGGNATAISTSNFAVTGSGSVNVSAPNSTTSDCVSVSGRASFNTAGTVTITSGAHGLACDDLSVSGGAVSVTGGGDGVVARSRVSVTGSGSLTAGSTGGSGIYIGESGTITIDTTGTVSASTASTLASEYAVRTYNGAIHIRNGTVTLLNTGIGANLYLGTLNHTGGTLNGQQAGGGVTTYAVTVGGVAVTDANQDNITGAGITGSVSYDPASKTLTLNNAVVDFGGSLDPIAWRVPIVSREDLTVRLVGDNRIGSYDADTDAYSLDAGIDARGKHLTITGDGNLTVYGLDRGIEARDITIDTAGVLTVKEQGSGIACALKANGGTLTIQRGTLNLTSDYSNGLYGGSIVINGGTITAHSLGQTSINIPAPLFAFNNAPTFGAGYQHRVFAGNDAGDATEVLNPTAATFTARKYVRIEPGAGGGNNGGGSSGGGGGGGRSTSTSPASPATGSGDTLSISGNDLGKQTSTSEEGKSVETFTLKEEVQKQIASAREEGQTSIEINIDSSREATAVVNVSAALLSGIGEMNLSLSTPHAALELPAALVQALAAAGQGLSVSVERGNAAAVATAMTGVEGAEGSQVLGTPAVINTPIQGQTTVTLPLSGISIPAEAEAGARAEFLAGLAVFVIHSDGEKAVINGTISYDAQGNPAGISFETDRFSTFAVIKTVQQKEIILGIGKLEATVNGKTHTLDAAPFIKPEAGRTLVPVRFVSEMLGAQVEWLAESRQVVVTEPGNKIILTIGADRASVNGQEKTLDCPAEIVNNRTFVPLRFISESLGSTVSWDEQNRSIAVKR